MKPAIRILGLGDRELLQRADANVFDNPIDPNLVSEFLSDARHHIAVALDNDQVVGFASGVHYVHPDKPAEMWINEVGVAPAYRARGIGRAVVRKLLDHAKTLGCREAWVLTDRGNEAAMRLYASMQEAQPPGDQEMFTFVLEREASAPDF